MDRRYINVFTIIIIIIIIVIIIIINLIFVCESSVTSTPAYVKPLHDNEH